MDLDERTVETVAKMGDYVSMGERLVLRVCIYNIIYIYTYVYIYNGIQWSVSVSDEGFFDSFQF